VLFLTDGLPTVGERSELGIREGALKGNVHNRRIFTFGVGFDVNAPLLNHLAEKSRAVSTVVLPEEDVEVKVSQVYRRLYGPVLELPKLDTLDENGAVTTRRAIELQPAAPPDLFEGDKLIVLGQYKGEEPLHFALSGSLKGKPRTFRFTFNLDHATTRNSFVPRLWASRKVAFLIEEIRQAGAAAGANTFNAGNVGMNDPRMKELVDEIVKLSTEFGILTEYTAFLAREGTDLAAPAANLRMAEKSLGSRAWGSRAGKGAVNQLKNYQFQADQVAENRRNAYYDADMKRVQVSNVQQINDRAFFQRGKRWLDSQTVNAKEDIKPDETVVFGSDKYFELVARLTKDNRQSVLALSGEILLRVDEKSVLVTAPEP